MIKVTYYCSACVGLTSPELSVLCDPWFTDGIYDGSWYQYPKLDDPLKKIPPYDLVYVSHIHPDHYDPTFLKGYLAKHPKTGVIIADFAENFLSKRMKSDGIPHTVVDELSQGQTSIKLFPNGADPLDIDSALAMKRGSESIVNMNDNRYHQPQVDAIKAFVGNPTIALLGYAGAGPYPQTYFEDGALLRQKAAQKKNEFFDRYRKLADALAPKKTIPFAGQYILGGRLSRLNEFRGVGDAVEVASFDPRAVVLDDGGDAAIDTASLHPTRVRQSAYDARAVANYCKSIEDRPMDYETYFKDLPLEAVPFRRLLPKAYANALRRSLCQSDYFLCLRLRDDEWFCMNTRADSDFCRFAAGPAEFSPRAELRIDHRYLFGLITCVFHWNNAEVGSQYMTRRIPDVHLREVYAFLSFLHV